MTAVTTRDILRDLIEFDTTSRNSNRPLIEYVVNYLRGYGIEPLLIWNGERTKANLWATIGPDIAGGVILSGHTDTVPVDGQAWESDPFILMERDGKLFGRGTCDMKGFLASALGLVPKLRQSEMRRPLHLAFSYDEEIGCVGVVSLVEHLRDAPTKAAWCLVGEPTDMRPVIGHKGGSSYRVSIAGREAHSSLAPQAVNAISYAAEFIVFLNLIGEKMRLGPTDPLYDVNHSTLSVGLIDGGSAINIVPRTCEFVFEYRYLRGIDPDAIFAKVKSFADNKLLPRMRSIAPESNIVFEKNYAYPGFEIDPDDVVVARVKAWVGSNTESKVAYGTEAGHFSTILDMPTIVCGPGSIIQAHRPDEFVARSQMEACDQLLDNIRNNYCC